jgi:hypothetical protein
MAFVSFHCYPAANSDDFDNRRCHSTLWATSATVTPTRVMAGNELIGTSRRVVIFTHALLVSK